MTKTPPQGAPKRQGGATVPSMPPRPNLVGACKPTIDRLNRQQPDRRIRMAFDLSNQIQTIQADIAAARRGAVRELRAAGWTLKQIADAAGITVSRVKQIQDGTNSAKRYRPVDAEPGGPGGRPPRPEAPDVLADEYA